MCYDLVVMPHSASTPAITSRISTLVSTRKRERLLELRLYTALDAMTPEVFALYQENWRKLTSSLADGSEAVSGTR